MAKMAKTKSAKKTRKRTKKQTKRKATSPAKKPSGRASGKRRVNWVLTIIMSVFFRTLGVDRFIMGHVGLGILKLITAGACGIWWLIDVILIATKYEFKDIVWVE